LKKEERRPKKDYLNTLLLYSLSSVFFLHSSLFPWTPDPLADLARPRYKREGLTLPDISCLIYLNLILAKQREDL